jgi:hypothetical protein
VVVNDINSNIVSIDKLVTNTDMQTNLTMTASTDLSQALSTIVKEMANFKFNNQ